MTIQIRKQTFFKGNAVSPCKIRLYGIWMFSCLDALYGQALFYLRRLLWDLTEIFGRMRGIARGMRFEWDIFFDASDIFFAK